MNIYRTGLICLIITNLHIQSPINNERENINSIDKAIIDIYNKINDRLNVCSIELNFLSVHVHYLIKKKG